MVELVQALELPAGDAGGAVQRRRRLWQGRAAALLKSPLPLSRSRFERRLAAALEEAEGARVGFYLGDYAGRRALGRRLVIEVDPKALDTRLRHRGALAGERVDLHDKFLGAGDWSELLQPLTGSSTHREVGEIVAAGFDYRRTRAYRIALDRAGGSNPVERNFVALKSRELVETYFRLTTDLCRSVREQGVASRAEFWRTANMFRNPRVRLPWVELMEADIGVAIGASGQLYRFASGKHRTAAAQALGLTSIPVEVRMVHAAWLARQMRETKRGPVEALLQSVRALSL